MDSISMNRLLNFHVGGKGHEFVIHTRKELEMDLIGWYLISTVRHRLTIQRIKQQRNDSFGH
jgi:hypothetical protein